jgi:hypothetical protein
MNCNAGRQVVTKPQTLWCRKKRTLFFLVCAGLRLVAAGQPERVCVGRSGTEFITSAGSPLIIWGVNYDHDENQRLIEEYWIDEWQTVVCDFQEIKALGANAVRVHLQISAFLDAPDQINRENIQQLRKLIQMAGETGLYLNLTGLGCYKRKQVPDWYIALDESGRWNAQSRFWGAVAEACAGRDAVFCYDLMNEPLIGGSGDPDDWTPGEFGGFCFVQRLTLDPAGRSREQIAQAWVEKMSDAIREHDSEGLITVGVIPWVYTFPKAKPLFYSPEVSAPLDFVSVHFYPEAGKSDRAFEALQAYCVGKPLVVEEFFPLKCSLPEADRFIDRAADFVSGWFSFYWGTPAHEYAQQSGIADALKSKWLNYFKNKSGTFQTFPAPKKGR